MSARSGYRAGMTDLATEALDAPARAARARRRVPDGQLEAIAALVARPRRVLVVQRTGWGKSAVYFVATRLLRDAGAGPDAARLAAARAHAQPDRGGRARRRARRARSTATTATSGTSRSPSVWRRRRSTCCSSRPSASPTPLPRRRAAADRADASACSSSTRRTASATGATTSAPTTAASPASSTLLPRGVPVLVHDRDRERPGRRRHRRPARRRAPHAPRPARPREPRARRVPTCRARPSGWRGSPRRSRRCRAPASSTRSPSPTRERVAEWLRRQGIEAARVHRRDRHRRPQLALEAGAARATSSRRRRDLRARHGLRQARPRVRRPLPVAGLADRLLPAGRPGRPRASTRRRRHPARRPRGPRHPGLLHPHRVPAARAGRSASSRCSARATPSWVPLHEIEDAVNVGRSRLESDAEDPRGRRRGRARGRRGTGARSRRGRTRRARRARHRAAAARAGGDARVRATRRVPHGVPAPRARRPGRAAVRSVHVVRGRAAGRVGVAGTARGRP